MNVALPFHQLLVWPQAAEMTFKIVAFVQNSGVKRLIYFNLLTVASIERLHFMAQLCLEMELYNAS